MNADNFPRVQFFTQYMSVFILKFHLRDTICHKVEHQYVMPLSVENTKCPGIRNRIPIVTRQKAWRLEKHNGVMHRIHCLQACFEDTFLKFVEVKLQVVIHNKSKSPRQAP